MHQLGNSPESRAQEFLRVAHRFRLGDLPTERPHPRTRLLSRWARDDLPRAVAVLRSIDLDALARIDRHAGRIDRLGSRVRATLDAGRRVYLCGCGATGRLALSLESLWRQHHPGDDRVRAFMAGGDVALVHSLEGFEDYPELGARHLEQMGFVDGDLLISCTEGGETPYVIGATERAAQVSSNRPVFLYCNADATLAPGVARFRRVRDNRRIERICLYVGPMALTGSTRMQASTVLQLAVGLAVLHHGSSAARLMALYRRHVRATDLAFLPGFVEREAEIYRRGDRVTYTVRDYGITVLTDTTERAPTFSLSPFDRLRPETPRSSLCYVALADTADSAEAWVRLLHREPTALDWPEVDRRTTGDYLRGFDFSLRAIGKRRLQAPRRTHYRFDVRDAGAGIALGFGSLAHVLPVDGLPALFRHLLLKQALNIHSTLVMGRLGRYTGNLMTWVSPTNGKLVDRAVRYVQYLLAAAGRQAPPYEEIVHRLFEQMQQTPVGDPVVPRTYRSIMRANESTFPASAGCMLRNRSTRPRLPAPAERDRWRRPGNNCAHGSSSLPTGCDGSSSV